MTSADRRIINHDVKNPSYKDVVGHHFYSARALGMSSPGDVIQLHPSLECEWDFIQQHYADIGLFHSDDVVWNVDYRVLAEYPEHQPSVFFFDQMIHQHRPDQERFDVVEHMDSKNNFMALADKLDVPTPLTLCFANTSEVDNIEALPYPCYIKVAVGVAGTGIYRCSDAAEASDALASFGADVPIQIQQEIIAETFLNLQYRINDGQLSRLACSEQILDGFEHRGNRYPARCEPWEIVDPLAEEMLQRGMKGVFAFDVGVVKSGTDEEYYAIECNPRFNGASYPTVVACKLDLKQWFAEQLNTSYRHLVDIDLSDILFDVETRKGVIIFNWGCLSVGKLGVLIAGNDEEIEYYDGELRKRLN